MKQGLTLRLLGRSGSGKDTQSELLQKEIKFDVVISMGNLIREIGEMSTVAGERMKKFHDTGGLPDAWIVNYLWQKELVQKIVTNEESIIIDAARRVEEAIGLDEVLNWFGRKLTPILIDVPREVAFDRLMKRKGKLYDNEIAINRRQDWYESIVEVTVKYYKKDSRLIRINGNQPEEKVHNDIMDALKRVPETKNIIPA